ncbi:VOC family protein [Terriglobus tenax]|uniref:VOC family protein n=1 Tax=Terriglobus tenax TaxID=1111115 RepID=UPI0021E0A510|nr:VOC family protein [Terriglobus tenax]
MISHIDHLVLTVASLEKTCSFYERVLNFERKDTPGRPTSLSFGACKLSVHEVSHMFEPKAQAPTPGSGDFCLITTEQIEDVIKHLQSEGVTVEQGPVKRSGAQGEMMSVYFRDPDQNLVEVSRYS